MRQVRAKPQSKIKYIPLVAPGKQPHSSSCWQPRQRYLIVEPPQFRSLPWPCSCGNARAEGIGGVEDQRRLGHHVRRPGDARDDAALDDARHPLEDAADDALLTPDLPLAQFAVSDQTSELGARAGAAR